MDGEPRDETPDASRQPELSVVLPAYNEEANIGDTLEQVTGFLEGRGLEYELLVVDDGSRDRTGAVVTGIAKANPAIRLLRHTRNRGYGAALRTGFAAARGRWVFFMDSDGQFDIRDLEGFLARRERADVLVGYRARRRDPPLRRLNAAGWNMLVRLLLGVPVRDVDCAFKLYRADVLRRLTITSSGATVNAEMLAQVRRLGYRLLELPVRHFPRTAGRATGNDPRVILRAFRELARLALSLRRGAHDAKKAPGAWAAGVKRPRGDR
ncbi:MAG: glycosyltransferase family 2 protein [Bacillota bacterium]|nr:glycosyltransferase family 2 protein [Bacillota bacterium]